MNTILKKNSNQLISVIVLSLFSILFYACSNLEKEKQVVNQIAPIEIKGQVNFVGQWMGEGQREFIVRDYVREFEFLHQDIGVNLKFPEEIGFNRYNTIETQKFIGEALMQANSEWDVMYINDDKEGISNYLNDPDWAAKYLVDFSAYPELINNTITEIDLNKVRARWNGIVPGPFLEGQYWAMWTNKNVMDKLGIEVKQFGMSFNDFLGYLQVLDNYNKNNDDYIKPFQEAGDWTTFFGIVFNLFISEVGNLEELYSDSISETKLLAWHKTLKACEQLADLNFLNDDYNGLLWNDIKNSVIDEQCLFFSNGSWMYNIWSQKDAQAVMNCVPNEFPAFGALPMYPSAYPIMWGVPKNSPNKEEAIEFLLKMSQPSMAEKWVRATKSPTGIKGNLANISFGTDQYEDFSFHVQKTYGSNTYKMSENNAIIFNQEHIHEPAYYLDVIQGNMSADEAMARIRESLGMPASN